MTETSWTIRIADWHNPTDQAAIRDIREQVFIKEQHVPVELEWDELDETCTHLLATLASGQAIATARIHLPENTQTCNIGRMSVLAEYRHQGIASQMLSRLKTTATDNNVNRIELNAQTTAIPFYVQHGFEQSGNEFLDAGIPHYKMFYTVKN